MRSFGPKNYNQSFSQAFAPHVNEADLVTARTRPCSTRPRAQIAGTPQETRCNLGIGVAKV